MDGEPTPILCTCWSKLSLPRLFMANERGVFVQHVLVQTVIGVILMPRVCLGIRGRGRVILERDLIPVSVEESSND